MLALPWGALVARVASTPPAALLREGCAVAADGAAPLDARRRCLCRLLRVVSPGRKRVAAAGDPAVRHALGAASLEELLAALELDLAPLLRRAASSAAGGDDNTPYRLAERRFRPPPGPAADSKRASVVFNTLDGVRDVSEAVAAGALDFGSRAAWRLDAALQAAAGIVRLPPGAPGAPDVFGLAASPGFYVLPGYLTLDEQEQLARAVLTRYAERPNRRNVDAQFDPDASNLIMTAAGEPRGGDYGRAVSSVAGDGASTTLLAAAAAAAAAGVPHRSDERPPTFPAGLWLQHMAELEALVAGRDAEQPLGGAPTPEALLSSAAPGSSHPWPEELLLAPSRHGWLSKLTWSTLGHQYDWTSRQYHLPGDTDFALHAHACDDGAAGPAAAAAATPSCDGGSPAPATATAAATTLRRAATVATAATGAGHGGATAAPAPDGSSSSHRWHAPFPADLRSLSERLAEHAHAAVAAAHATRGGDAAAAAAAGLPLAPFDPQAGICNCYQYGPHGRPLRGVPMGGHRDDMERRQDRPVLSFSVGCAAVFLLGGSRKEDAPVPVLVRSGDALLLSGAARLAFHGVARVFDASAPSELFAPLGAAAGAHAGAPRERLERAALRAFVRHARLNVNVRQVQ